MLNLTPLQVTKAAATFIVGAGTSKIVTGIIRNNTDPETIIQKIEVVAAGAVIGSMAADATRKYTDAKIDEIVVAYNNFKNRTKTEEQTEDTDIQA